MREPASPQWLETEALLAQRRQKKWDEFSWISARALLQAFNDVFNRVDKHLVSQLRAEWMHAAEGTKAGSIPAEALFNCPDDADHVIRCPAKRFVVIGDTGEQDASQYVVVPELMEVVRQADVDFLLICSDVIYPSGDVNDYEDGFAIPYRELLENWYGTTLFALPGNHDWYDGLAGFMYHWCGLRRRPGSVYGPGPGPTPSWFARVLWRRPARPRFAQDRVRHQRTPYFAIDTGQVLLVCIDTGITGDIDHAQGRWLLRVSQRSGPKILVTGKPLVVNRLRHPCRIEDDGVHLGRDHYPDVLSVVGDPRFEYVASVGGDVHNFQWYPPDAEQGLAQDHIVIGGGGAYMSSTHQIDEGVSSSPAADTVRPARAISPTPAQSLSHFADLMLPRVWRLMRALVLVVVGLAATAVPWPDDGSRRAWLGGAVLTAVGAAAARLLQPSRPLLRRAKKTRAYRAALCLYAVLLGVVAGLVGRELAPGHGQGVVWFALAGVAFSVLCSFTLRWTGWWRPRRPDAKDPVGPSVERARVGLRDLAAPARPSAGIERPGRLRLVGVALALTAVAGAVATQWWLWWSAGLTAVVWVYGVAQGRRPKGGELRGSWRTLAVVLSYGVFLADLVFAASSVTRLGWGWWVVLLDLLVDLGIVAAIWLGGLYVVVSALAGLGLVPVGPPLSTSKLADAARRRGRLGLLAPWISLGLLLPALALVWSTRPHPWARPQSETVRLIAPTLVVLLVGGLLLVVLMDFVRRHTGRGYPLALLAIAVGVVALVAHEVAASPQWWSRASSRVIAGELTVAMLLVVATALGQLVLIGAPILALHGDFRRRLRDPVDLVGLTVAEEVLEARRAGLPRPPGHRAAWADVVSPGADQPRGPLQDLVAQVFDSNEPPFFKNFLVAEQKAGGLELTVKLVTGDGPATDLVTIHLPTTVIARG